MSLLPQPKFHKRIHHVVPVFWQNAFGAAGEVGPFYKNIKTGVNFKPQGPGRKMASELVNIVFDKFFRPSDKLEDMLANIETKAGEGLSRLINTQNFDDESRADVAMLLAVQACRYPEYYATRLDLGKYLAIALGDFRKYLDADSVNRELNKLGIPVSIEPNDFKNLSNLTEKGFKDELDQLLGFHGYEADFNPELVLAGALRIAEHLLALRWTLLSAAQPKFILSDHPVPEHVGLGFSVGLSGSLGLILEDAGSADVSFVEVRTASEPEIEKVNAEVRGRAVEWICGPGTFVHQL